jgi:superfamily II DNA/RNA helicase
MRMRMRMRKRESVNEWIMCVIEAVDWVVQLDCPENVDTYIHRVGRTARYSLIQSFQSHLFSFQISHTLSLVQSHSHFFMSICWWNDTSGTKRVDMHSSFFYLLNSKWLNSFDNAKYHSKKSKVIKKYQKSRENESEREWPKENENRSEKESEWMRMKVRMRMEVRVNEWMNQSENENGNEKKREWEWEWEKERTIHHNSKKQWITHSIMNVYCSESNENAVDSTRFRSDLFQRTRNQISRSKSEFFSSLEFSLWFSHSLTHSFWTVIMIGSIQFVLYFEF